MHQDRLLKKEVYFTSSLQQFEIQ